MDEVLSALRIAALERYVYEPASGILLWRKARIKARNGKEAGWVARNGYRYVELCGKDHLAHRLIWLMERGAPPSTIDHLDGDPLNNRLANLRDGSGAVNAQNLRRAKRGSSSGLLGVHRHAQNGNWVAEICVNGRNKHLGCFNTAEAAHAAYVEAKRALHVGCTI